MEELLACGHSVAELNNRHRCRACHREAVRRHRAEGPKPARTFCVRGHDLTLPDAVKLWGGRRYCYECKKASHQRVYARQRARREGVGHMLLTQPIKDLLAREDPAHLEEVFARRYGTTREEFEERVAWLTRKYAPLEVVDEFCCALNLPTAYVYGDAYLSLPARPEEGDG